MADTDTATTVRSGAKRSIDAGMAALAALSVAFFGYAMPADLFRDLAGTGDRTLILAAAAALTFAIVYALLRALGRLPSARKRRIVEMPAEPPRLRRADAHPDAPSRTPLFARFELGDPIPAEEAPEMEAADIAAEPVEEAALKEAEASEDPAVPGLLAGGLEISEGEPVERRAPDDAELDRPLPSFLPVETEAAEEPTVADVETPQPVAGPEEAAAIDLIEEEPAEIEVPAPVAQPEEVATIVRVEEDPVAVEAPEPVAEPEEAPAIASAEEDITPEQEPFEVAAEEQPASIEEFAPAEEPLPEEEALVLEPEQQEPPAVAEPEETLVLDEAEPAALAEEEAASDEPTPAEAAAAEEPIEAIAERILPEPRDESVSELMGRLEIGLSRRDRARWLGEDSAAPSAPADDRLRSALGMLRRMAGRKS